MSAYTNRCARRGVALIVALLFLTMLSTLAVALVSTNALELKKSENLADAKQALLAAESGLGLMARQLQSMEFPAGTTSQDLLDYLYAKLQTQMEGTANLASQPLEVVRYGEGGPVASIVIPTIALEQGAFTCCLTTDGADGCRVTVQGTCGCATRSVYMTFSLQQRRAVVFDYGIASKGRISVAGNGIVTGMNDPSEATILSVRGGSPAIQIAGSAEVGGGLYVTGETEDYVLLGRNGNGGGGFTVGGSSDPDEIWEQNVHLDVDEPEFPTLATADLEALATDEVDASENFHGSGREWTNIRIKANTNPTFRNDAVINGVMYVEYPNVVSFRGQVTLNGVIVTEEASCPDYDLAKIEFRGGFSAPGVSALPDTEEFAAAKAQSGSVILAPGFALDFQGNSQTINGVIAADQIDFRGNSTIAGELYGCILGLKDEEMVIQGSTSIRINRLSSDNMPAGFAQPMGLAAVPDTYGED